MLMLTRLARRVVYVLATYIVALAACSCDAEDARLETRPPIDTVDGWTAFTVQPEARIIHVASDGDDGAPGTENAPKATLQAGFEALRDGHADWLLLRRGDRWRLTDGFGWTKSGPAEPSAGWMRMGAYGDLNLPRPMLQTGDGSAMVISPGWRSDRVIQNVAITDIHIVADGRLANPHAASPAMGFQTLAVEYRGQGSPIRRLLFENCKIQGYDFGYSGSTEVEDLLFRRNIFTEIFRPGDAGAHASGLLSSARGLWIEENVFYLIQHPDLPAVTAQSGFSHSGYITAEAVDVVTRGNFIIKAFDGIMQRPGGVYALNVSAHNEVSGLLGESTGVRPTPNGVEVSMQHNLLLNSVQGYFIGNTRRGVVRDNLFVRDEDGTHQEGLTLMRYNQARSGDQVLGVNMGVHDVTFANNYLSGQVSYGGGNPDDRQSYSGLSFENNTEQAGTANASIAGFLSHIGRSGSTIDDWARILVERDRVTFGRELQTTTLINYYRDELGLPPVP